MCCCVGAAAGRRAVQKELAIGGHPSLGDWGTGPAMQGGPRELPHQVLPMHHGARRLSHCPSTLVAAHSDLGRGVCGRCLWCLRLGVGGTAWGRSLLFGWDLEAGRDALSRCAW